jgi:glycosyl transferase family 25
VRTYVINLARSPERRKSITAQLTAYGVDFEIVEAVDGRELDLTDAAVIEAIAPSFLSADWFRPTHAACAMSHLSVCRKILADGLDYALVLEDDVIVPADVSSLADAVAAHMTGAEVALLNFDSPNVCVMSRRDARELPGSRQLMLPVDISQLVSGAAYVITREACKRMAKQEPPVCAKADDWAWHCREGILENVRCVVPMVATKDSAFASTIGYYSEFSFKARMLQVIAKHDLRILQRVVARRRERIWRKYTRIAFEDDRTANM